MNREDFLNLKRGDIVQNTGSGQSFVIESVTQHNGSFQFLGIRTCLITNPTEWKKVPSPGVLIPHTFETAVKAVAEKGPHILNTYTQTRTITAIGELNVKLKLDRTESAKTYSYVELTDWVHEFDKSPFAQVTYEEQK